VPGFSTAATRARSNIELDHKDLFINLKNERFHASILTLDLAGTKQQVLLRAVNMHPFSCSAACRLPARRQGQEDPHERCRCTS